MQNIITTPPHAQHVPDGWSFPTAGVARPTQPSPVPGGGPAAPATMTRVRWGRILPVLAGIALLAFGLWSATKDATPVTTRSASGGGDVAIAESEGADAVDTVGPAAVVKPTVVKKPVAAKKPAAKRPARRGARRVAAVNAFTAATAGATTASGAGASGAPEGELPMTGLSTWIAAFLGILLLAAGICVQVNAVRLGMTAMLYRRGILLRPVDCARLAQEHGLARTRVVVSNLLHRLLEDPTPRGGEFVTARLAR